MNADLIDRLAGLVKRDADVRSRLLAEERLYGQYDEAMQAVHRDNARELEAIIETHGWPGVELVGVEGSRMAWLIAQHANCTPDLQRKFLASMREAADRGDVGLRLVAHLTDRVLFNEGKPLLYGTVLDWNADGELSCDLIDPDGVDDRRSAAGMPPFLDDLHRHREETRAEGGQCPADFAAYKRRRREWAEAMGWRSPGAASESPEQG